MAGDKCLGLGHVCQGVQEAEVLLQGLTSKMWVRKWGRQMRTVELGTVCVGCSVMPNCV